MDEVEGSNPSRGFLHIIMHLLYYVQKYIKLMQEFLSCKHNIVNHANFARKYGVAAFNNSGKYKLTDYNNTIKLHMGVAQAPLRNLMSTLRTNRGDTLTCYTIPTVSTSNIQK